MVFPSYCNVLRSRNLQSPVSRKLAGRRSSTAGRRNSVAEHRSLVSHRHNSAVVLARRTKRRSYQSWQTAVAVARTLVGLAERSTAVAVAAVVQLVAGSTVAAAAVAVAVVAADSMD